MNDTIKIKKQYISDDDWKKFREKANDEVEKWLDESKIPQGKERDTLKKETMNLLGWEI